MSEGMIHKTLVAETKAIDADAGIYEAMISTEDVDRDSDVIRADGADIESYLKNPVVLFGHDYYSARSVVGRALEVERLSGTGVRARWQFAGPEVSEEAALVHRLWAGGFLNAVSIGFIPHEWRERTDENGEKLRRGYEYTNWELLEFSIVPVPANQNALRLMAKGLSMESTPETAISVEQQSEEPEATNDDDNELPPEVIDALNGLVEDLQHYINNPEEGSNV